LFASKIFLPEVPSGAATQAPVRTFTATTERLAFDKINATIDLRTGAS
jgi:hypothetical protein